MSHISGGYRYIGDRKGRLVAVKGKAAARPLVHRPLESVLGYFGDQHDRRSRWSLPVDWRQDARDIEIVLSEAILVICSSAWVWYFCRYYLELCLLVFGLFSSEATMLCCTTLVSLHLEIIHNKASYAATDSVRR